MKNIRHGSFRSKLKMAFLLLPMVCLHEPGQAQAPDTLRALVLLVDFSDAPGTLTVAQVKDLLNKPGYTDPNNPYSARDYWYEVSGKRLEVLHDVFGTYRATQTAAYYRTKTYHEGITLAAEGFNWIVKTMPGYDWNALTVDKDNRFRGLTILTSTQVPGSGGAHYIGDKFIAPNQAKGHRLSSVVAGGSLFVFNHEFGHIAFNWPDLYSITGGRGTGMWELMSGNANVPGIPNAAYRAGHGWMEMLDASGQQTVTLEENGPTAVRFRNPKDPKEFFVVEARNSSLRTTKTPAIGRGLLVWHFEENVPGNGNYNVDGEKMTLENHYEVSLEQADGLFDLENGRNGGDIGDAFVPGKSFGVNTVPNSRWWDGTPSGFGVDDIKLVGDNRISFRLTAPGVAPVLTMGGAPKLAGLWMNEDRLNYRIPGEYSGPSRQVSLSIHALDGSWLSDVISSPQRPGTYSISLGAQGVRPPGLYLGRLRSGSSEASAVIRLD